MSFEYYDKTVIGSIDYVEDKDLLRRKTMVLVFNGLIITSIISALGVFVLLEYIPGKEYWVSTISLLIMGLLLILVLLLRFITKLLVRFVFKNINAEPFFLILYYIFITTQGYWFSYTFASGFIIYENFGQILFNSFLITSFIFGSLYYFTYLTKPNTNFMKKYLFAILIFYLFANIIVWITCIPEVQRFLINGGVDPNSIISVFPIVCGDTIDIILSSFGALLFTGYLYYSFGKLMRGDYGSPALLAWDIYWSVLLLFNRILKLNKILAGR